MKVTYCKDRPKKFICERDEAALPGAGGFVDLDGVRYAVKRVEKLAREALVYVVPD